MNDVFPQYRDLTLEQFEATSPGLVEAVTMVNGYIERIALARAKGLGLTFLGQSGIGKTMMASIVMGAAKNTGHKIECIELATYIDLYLEAIRGPVEDAIDADRNRRAWDHLRRIEKVHFLFVDDLGREHESASGWSNERIFDLMRYRHNRCLPTLITTNLPLPELNLRYSEGMSSHLHGSSLFVVMDGEDYRAGKGLAYATWADRD